MDRLPAEVRARVLALAAEHLSALALDVVPVSLQQVRRFTPAKRAKAGASALTAALESNGLFRAGVVAHAKQQPAETLVQRAARAYLLGDGWEELAADIEAQKRQQHQRAEVDAVRRLTEQLEAVRATGRDELTQLRAEVAEAQAELSAQRKKVREMGDRAGRAEAAQKAAEGRQGTAEQALAQLQETQAGALRVLQDQVDDAERALAQARTQARDGHKDDQLRLRLLLDTLVGAAQGLRRELALPPAQGRPADALAGDYAEPTKQGRSDDDPALLDALLTMPTVHLLVDGYNITKTAYPSATLEQQRTRLLAGLGSLAARTQAEVTVVWDGADGVTPVALKAPRGIRQLFSRTGETADEVLRRLAAAEPAGRPVVVASSDKEVHDGVRRTGARPVPAVALVRLLERGSVGGSL